MAIRQPSPTRRYTEEEYFALGDSKPYAEYLDGVIVRKAMPDGDQVYIAKRLIVLLDQLEQRHGGTSGPEPRIRFRAQGRIYHRIPDVAHWAADRERGPKRAMNPPTLAAEIRSPGETMRSQREKCRFMHRNGVEVCWLFDPESRTVEVFEGGATRVLDATATLGSGHLPGFALALGPLFAALDESDGEV